MSAPNEEIHLEYIRPITGENHRLYILLSIEGYSKRPTDSFCKLTDGETAVNLFTTLHASFE